MRKIVEVLFSLATAFIPGQLIGQEVNELTDGANEVVLFNHESFMIKDEGKAVHTVSFEVLLLNKKAKHFSSIIIPESDFQKLSDFKLSYGSESSGFEKVRIGDLQSYANNSGLLSDNRVLYYDIKPKNYPCKVSGTYTVKLKNLMFYPTFYGQPGENISVRESSFTIHATSKDQFHYSTFHIGDPQITEADGAYKYTWTADSLSAFEWENFNPRLSDYTPTVQTAPNKFKMAGYEGDLSDWNKFGMFNLKLLEGRDDLEKSDIQDLLSSVPPEATQEEKVRLAYKYLQDKVRYVSIQLGIGGWQPFSTKSTHETSYGDCKALSLYMQSILGHMNIPSYYTVVSSGSSFKELNKDHPASVFNHAYLTVPMDGDTTWLECTSQTTPFGYSGLHTGNRKALMITEEGGKVINTKYYSKNDNVESSKTQVTILSDGNGEVQMVRRFKGLETENFGVINVSSLPEKEQLEWLRRYYDIAESDLLDFEITAPTNEPVPQVDLIYSAKIRGVATKSSDRLFFKPFQFNNSLSIGVKSKERNAPVRVLFPYTQIDTVQISFPQTSYPEALLKDSELTSKYGSYKVDVVQDATNFTVVRKFQLNDGEYPASEYKEFRTFIRSVQKLDKKRIVMLDKT